MSEAAPLPPPSGTAPAASSAQVPIIVSTSTRSTPRWVGVAAGIALIVGALGPWVTASSAFGNIAFDGMSRDGKLTAALGVAVVVLFLVCRNGWVLAGRIITTALAGIIAGIDYLDVQHRVDSVSSDTVSAAVGWGLWLTCCAAIVGFIVAILAKD